MQEAEESAERERMAASNRLRETCERYEQQQQVQRMRLVADFDLQLEAAEAARREDKRKAEAAAEAAAAAAAAKEAALKEEWQR